MKQLIYIKNYCESYLRSYKKLYQKEPKKEETYRDFGILNPAIGSLNLGDLIIYDSVYKVLRKIFEKDIFINFPTQIHTSFDAKLSMSQRDLLFVSGTNLLSSNLETRNQWKIDNSHKRFLKNKVVLIGCGWWQYQDEINNYTAKIYRSVLNNELIHSARDNYTVEKLNSIGIRNVLNTTCPTFWEITPEKCKKIKKTKERKVVTTLTFYKRNSVDDKRMLEILSRNYDTVFLWLQSYDDLVYLNEIQDGIQNIEIIPPTLEAYDMLLKKGGVDYVGTRLHAGARALQNNIRTLILAVDNRAVEIGKDINLNVIKREDVEQIQAFINGSYETLISLPNENIQKFKEHLIDVRRYTI
ncbi:polysaccharide pyruvyl transferase family protein [Maribellus comscasis]|uniref:Polysaccharide pyruvyl transferase family protein n=1 Tax=Maribellus comscasis TaxID=2681766 RepID=A0A6I6JXQ4_9BACT|nr:polysaccharide pyruvyl transferase family protein [Maribellus comscasis]QGY43923.1 polysaccharide pyruvyl transferase family protein [Maribellus comscasis]